MRMTKRKSPGHMPASGALEMTKFRRTKRIDHKKTIVMLKPTDDELHTALTEAQRMYDRGADPHHLARSLLYHEHRVRLLEAVFDAAKQYLQFGQEEHAHAVLANAIEAARSDTLHDSGSDDETLGL